MQIDDATLFLSKFTKYSKSDDLHELAPRLFLDYKKQCLKEKIPSMDYVDFYYFTIEWLDKDILTKN